MYDELLEKIIVRTFAFSAHNLPPQLETLSVTCPLPSQEKQNAKKLSFSVNFCRTSQYPLSKKKKEKKKKKKRKKKMLVPPLVMRFNVFDMFVCLLFIQEYSFNTIVLVS